MIALLVYINDTCVVILTWVEHPMWPPFNTKFQFQIQGFNVGNVLIHVFWRLRYNMSALFNVDDVVVLV